MSVEGQKPYPGETASPAQILSLAQEYRRAADLLSKSCRRGEPVSQAPFRLVAIQAIELYLNAFLLHAGYPASNLRGLQHDLAKRTHLAGGSRLILKQRTKAHLESISDTREYLVSRYDPISAPNSRMNRLNATLTEIAEKVASIVICTSEEGATAKPPP